MSTFAKSTQLLLFPLVLLLLSGLSTLRAQMETKHSTNGWMKMASGQHQYGRVTTGLMTPSGGTEKEYWVLSPWRCDTKTGKWVIAARIARSPREDSVSDAEARIINRAYENGNGLSFTTTAADGFENPLEDPNNDCEDDNGEES